MKLKIEMIPKSSWNVNLRSLLTQTQWDKVRNLCYEKAGYACEICHTFPPKGRLHCHEVWEFDDATNTQKLSKLEAVCNRCHLCKHIGFAVMQDHDGKADLELVVNHFLTINQISLDDFHEYFVKELRLWEERSKREWNLDTAYLDEYMFINGVRF